MIKAIIVDDEFPAIKMAESVLNKFEEIQITGTFTDQDVLLEQIMDLKVDLIFLDIKMPGLHGLELAGRINEIRSDVHIVFVTAYDNYAIDAFEMETLDYILKPITEDRVKKTLERYLKRSKEKKELEGNNHFSVYSFGRFSIKSANSEKLKFRTVKAEELFAFLLHNHGKAVTKEKIMEELWYDRDSEKAQSILYTTMYQLRKDLDNFGIGNVIETSRKEGGVCYLTWVPEFCDCSHFVKVYSEFRDGNHTVDSIIMAIDNYQTGYLSEHGYLWASAKALEYEIMFNEMINFVIQHEVGSERYNSALMYLNRWLEINPSNEVIHAKIIGLYLLQDYWNRANEYYQKLKQAYEEEGLLLEVNIGELIANPHKIFE